MAEDAARVEVQRPEGGPLLNKLGDEAPLREPVGPAQAVAVGIGLPFTAREAQAWVTERRVAAKGMRFSHQGLAGVHLQHLLSRGGLPQPPERPLRRAPSGFGVLSGRCRSTRGKRRAMPRWASALSC